MSGHVDPELDPDVGADAMTAPSPSILLTCIGVGGAVGTLARYGLSQAFRPTLYGFSWATFLANVAGAFLLGLLVALVARLRPRSPYLRPALGTGVLGGFTTFSTFMVETAQRVDHGHAPTALLYVVATLACGLVASLAGLAVGGRT
jgi:CrcB protein